MLFKNEYFQSIAFHVEVHPNITHFTQCVTFGFYPTRYHELAHNLFRMTAIYIVPLLVIVISYSLIICEISRKTGRKPGELQLHNNILG